MFKTILGLAVAGFVVKRCAPDAYDKAVQAASDLIDTASDVTSALRGQAKAYACEAASDAATRLQAVNPNAIEELRAMLDGTAPSQPAQQRPAPRRAVRRP